MNDARPTREALARRKYQLQEARVQSPDDQWGVGNAADAKAYGQTTLRLSNGERQIDLIQGQFPHSRSDDRTYGRLTGTLPPDAPRIYSFSGHRVRVHLDIQEYNYLKESDLSGDDIRKGCMLHVQLNDVLAYGKFTRTYSQALHEAAQLVPRLLELPVSLAQPGFPELIGRRVRYQGCPATVELYFPEQGALILALAPGCELPPPDYLSPEERELYDPKDDENQRPKIDLFSERLWWWDR